MKIYGIERNQAIAVLTIITLSVISYGEILGYYFTDLDAFPLIKSGRIESLQDVGRIFSEPLMGSIVGAFPEGAFYRPVATFSYSIDYWIWGMDSAGYHLTDVVLHISTSIAVFYLVRGMLDSKSTLLALVAAVIFAIHPINMEVVPAIARRSDILASLFLVLTVISCAKYKGGNKRHLYISTGLCVLALGSKESGIVVLPIIFMYLMLFAYYDMDLKERLKSSLFGSTPYLIVGALYLCLHWYVCNHQEVVYPGQSYSLAAWYTIRGYLIGLFFPSFNLPLQHFFESLKEIISNRGALLTIVAGVSCLAIIIYRYGDVKTRTEFFRQLWMDRKSPETRVVLFFLSWLVISGGLFVVGKQFTIRYLYPLAIASSVLLALGFWFGARFIKKSAHGHSSRIAVGLQSALLSTAFVSLASQLYLSPLINDYDEWEKSGNITEQALEQTTQLIAGLPDNSDFYLLNYPLKMDVDGLRLKNLEHTRMLLFYGVQSYIDLIYPDKKWNFYGLSALVGMQSAHDVDIGHEISNGKMLIEIEKGGLLFEDTSHRKYRTGYFEVADSRDGKRLAIQAKKDSLKAPDSYFLLYTGRNVELISLGQLAVSDAPG